MSDFGELLKNLRQRANLTQKELGEKLHISETMVSYYEHSRRYPSADILKLMAEVFHVSVDYLLGLEKKEMTLDLSGFPDKDVEFLRSVAQFLQGKNEIQEKNRDREQKESEDRDKEANC